MVAVKGTMCLKGTYSSFGSCTSLCSSVFTFKCLQRHLLMLEHEKLAKLYGMLQFYYVESHVVYSHPETHLCVSKNRPIEGKRRITLQMKRTL